MPLQESHNDASLARGNGVQHGWWSHLLGQCQSDWPFQPCSAVVAVPVLLLQQPLLQFAGGKQWLLASKNLISQEALPHHHCLDIFHVCLYNSNAVTPASCLPVVLYVSAVDMTCCNSILEANLLCLVLCHPRGSKNAVLSLTMSRYPIIPDASTHFQTHNSHVSSNTLLQHQRKCGGSENQC